MDSIVKIINCSIKMIKNVSCIFLAALTMLLNSFPAFSQSKVNSLFKSIDENPGIYTLNDGNLQ